MSVDTRLKVLVSCMKRAVAAAARQLRVPEAVDDMVIDHPRSLHKGVADRCPDKLETALFQILAHCIGFAGGARNVAQAPPRILQRCAIYELPDIGIKAAEIPLHLDKCFGVDDGGFNLQPVADNSGIFKQPSQFPLSILRDHRGLEIVKGRPVVLALSQHGDPAQPGLRALEKEKLEKSSIIMEGRAPFAIMVGDIKRVIVGPATSCNSHSVRRLYYPDNEFSRTRHFAG
jgi:hypothetical protein